ncbi:MAG: DUF465 domain-containing protein [Candidatus Aminicenantales bacterium]
MDEKALKERLLRESEEFRRLVEEHRRCEERLEVLKTKGHLSEEEQLEERQLKKKKLALKDKMYILMQERQKSL